MWLTLANGVLNSVIRKEVRKSGYAFLLALLPFPIPIKTCLIQPCRNKRHTEQSQGDLVIHAKSITDQLHHPATSRHLCKPSLKQPNHAVKLQLTAGSQASPYEIARARSEQLKLANTFIALRHWNFLTVYYAALLWHQITDTAD